jgi:hypothetical protein
MLIIFCLWFIDYTLPIMTRPPATMIYYAYSKPHQPRTHEFSHLFGEDHIPILEIKPPPFYGLKTGKSMKFPEKHGV